MTPLHLLAVWLAAAAPAKAAAAPLNGASPIAIVRLVRVVPLCLNSLASAAVYEVVEPVKGDAPAHSTVLLTRIDGGTRSATAAPAWGLAAVHRFTAEEHRQLYQLHLPDGGSLPTLQGPNCQPVADGTVEAFVPAKSLAEARALAATLPR